MNNFQKIVTLLLVCLLFEKNYADEMYIGVNKFEQTDYHAARQNWCVSSAGHGEMYFANHNGLLKFDGTNWELNQLPNETILRAVNVQNDSLIYSSGYMELGYWKKNIYGQLNYTSLKPKATEFIQNNIEFWNIAANETYVYFQAFPMILAYHADSITAINFHGTINVMSKVHDKILVAVLNQGIYEIKNNTFVPFIQDDLLKNTQVNFIIPFKENQILIGTASSGIYLWDGAKLTRWNSKWTAYFDENGLNRGYVTNDSKIITGTLIDGIVVFDFEGNVIMKVNTEKGLSNNTVLGIEVDEWGNIWLALDNGIGFISGNQNPGFTIEDLPGTGAIYSVAIDKNTMYLGTNQGLFAKPLGSSSTDITLVPGTQSQTWDCRVIDNNLFAGHNQGTFLVNGLHAKLISEHSGGFAIRRDNQNPDLLIQCTYNNLVTYEKNGSNYQYRGQINGFADLIRYIEIDHLGNLWASHMRRGVYKIITDDQRENVMDTTYYGESTFGKDHSIQVFKIENRIVFTSNEMIYTYDDLNDTILPYETLNTAIGKYKTSHRIIEAPNHHYWFIGDSYIGLFSIFQDEIQLIKEYPTSLFNEKALVENFENILPLTEKTAILCLQNSVAHLNAEINDPGKTIRNYRPEVSKIELSTDRGRKGVLPLNSNHVKIKNNFHNIYFRFSFPRINEIPVSYQYNLEGLNSEWSEKTSSPELRFERLAKGEYTLRVKAVDLWENESRSYKFSFVVSPPWYASNLAFILYFVTLVLLLLLFRMWGVRHTKKREKQQHEERERELIRLRNEKLRNEIEHKSKELANSTMSIIKKNEFLLNLKKIVDKQKTELGSRYPDKYFNYLNKKIDENISNQDDWQIFETNFESAHAQFFKKIKDNYPGLTSSDLRLCAYLRMNLSSKEIAPLLGISVRGVENHRYRLRKKLNLEHDESLTDTILSL